MNWIVILPWTVLVLLSVLGGATWWFRSRVLAILSSLRVDLREIERDTRHLEGLILAEFSENNPKQISDQLVPLRNQLNTVVETLQDHYRLYGEFHQKINRIFPRNKPRILLAPYDWSGLFFRTIQFERDQQQITQKYQETFRQVQDVREIAWTIGQKYREVYVVYRDSTLDMENMLNQGVYGASLEKIIEEMDRIERLVAEIPVYYLTETKPELVRLADKNSISQVFTFLEENEQSILRVSNQVSHWKESLSKSYTQMGEVQNCAVELQELFLHIPEDLDVADMQLRLDKILQDCDGLDKQIANPEADTLSSISKQSYRMMRILKDMKWQIDEAIKNLGTYNSLQQQVNSTVQRLSEEMERLERNPVHPVVFVESKSRLSVIRNEMNKFQLPPDIRKKPPQLAESLKGLLRVAEQITTFDDRIQTIRKQHTEFLLLLKSIDVRQALVWVGEAESLAENIKVYDPGNWSRRDDLRILPDLEVLKESLEHVLPSQPGKVIPENELSRLYKEAFNTSELYQELKDQVGRVQSQYLILEEQEKEQQQQLNASLKALDDLSLMAEKNSTLDEIIAGDVDPLHSQLEKEQINLSQTHKGVLEKKLKKVETLSETTRQQIEAWLKEFSNEIDRMKEEVSGLLRDADKISRLEDPIIQEAKDLLTSDVESVGRQDITGKPLNDLVEGFRKLNREWQGVAIVYPKLTQIVKPVISGYSEVLATRESTTATINQIASNPDIRRTTSFQRLEREFFDLEHEIERIKTNKYRGLYLSSRLKEFSNQYQDITERIKHLTTRVANHQEQVNTLTNEMDTLLNSWETRLAEYREIPSARREIAQLISEVQTNYQQIQSNYKQSGELSQQQIYLLNTNVRKMKEKVVSIGNRQWVDLDGNVKEMS